MLSPKMSSSYIPFICVLTMLIGSAYAPCLEHGDPCQREGSCCTEDDDPYTCADGECKKQTPCAATGKKCISTGGCCKKTEECEGGICKKVCSNRGGKCGGNIGCCDRSDACLGGICKLGCALDGATCDQLQCCGYQHRCINDKCKLCARNRDFCYRSSDCCLKGSVCHNNNCKGCLEVGQYPSERDKCRANVDCCAGGVCDHDYLKGHCKNKPDTSCVPRAGGCTFDPKPCCKGLACKPRSGFTGGASKSCQFIQAPDDYPEDYYYNYPDHIVDYPQYFLGFIKPVWK